MDFKFEIKNFSLKKSLECGQCFRFKEIKQNEFLIFSNKTSAIVKQIENSLIFYNSNSDEKFWKTYFNYDINYLNLLKNFKGDLILEKTMNFCSGLRIFKQDPYETLISFIFSVNNNISRIKKIIETVCENFGEKIENGYSFPSLNILKNCGKEDFKILKAGFRVNFLLDAIKKIESKVVNFSELYFLTDEEIKKTLKKIHGVGEKVSSCVSLFAYNRMKIFPKDVWVKRVIKEYYENGLSKQFLTCPGLAQQFLFYGKRSGYI